MENIPMQQEQNPEQDPEAVEKERFYILVNKETRKKEGVVSATLPELESKPVKIDEFGTPTHLVRESSSDPLFANVDRARNQLNLDPEKYALFGPYDNEESAKAEEATDYSAAPVNAVEELIRRDEIRIKERKRRELKEEKQERKAA